MSTNATSQLLSEIERGVVEVENQVRLTPINWPSTEPPFSASNLPTKGSTSYITSRCIGWNVNKSRRGVSAAASLEFSPDELGSIGFETDYNYLIEIFQRFRSATQDTGLLKVGTFLIDNVEEDISILPGRVSISARDPIKFMSRRVWTGKLEPDKITMSNRQMTRFTQIGMEYVEFYDGSSRGNHTVNWAPSPSPKLWIRKDDGSNGKSIPLDGTNVAILFGLGVVRVNRHWFFKTYGNKNINCTYRRYALWEDSFGTSYYLNSPEDLIKKMALYAGFQDSDSSKPFYIKLIEPTTLPRYPSGAFIYDDSAGTYTDRTREAGDDTEADVTFLEAINDILYIGVLEQKFAGLHFSLSTRASGGSWVYEYWNGSTWASITLNIDTTNNLAQTGIVNWKSMNLSTWTRRSGPGGAMLEAYWIRLRCTTAPSTPPVATSILPGFVVQTATPRYTNIDDMKPMDILNRVVRPFVLPNYYWRCDENGDFEARYTYQQSTPDYTLTALENISKDPIRDDQIFTGIHYRGRRFDRLNAAARMNGCIASLSPDLPTSGLEFDGDLSRINDGVITNTFAVKYKKDVAPAEPRDIILLRFPSQGLAATIYEMELKKDIAYTLLPETITGTIKRTFLDTQYTIDYTSSPKNLGKLTLNVSSMTSGIILYCEVFQDEKTWSVIASVDGTQVGQDVTFTFRRDQVKKVRLRITSLGLFGEKAVVSKFELYSYTLPDISGGITWTSDPAGAHTAAHDGNISTGSDLTKYGHYINASFTPQAVGTLTLTAATGIGGILNIEHRVSGESNYTLFAQLMSMGKETYTFSGGTTWNNIQDMRVFVLQPSERMELSEIEIFFPEGWPEYGAWSIYYSSTSTDSWEPLPKLENITPQPRRTSLTKNEFGDEIYPHALKLICDRWARCGDWDKFFLSEIRVWLGDTIYATAKMGETYPYTTQTHKDFAAKMGWPSFVNPSIDDTASTQRAVEFNALQLLREFARVWEEVRITGMRPDIDLGDTVKLESFVKDRLSLAKDAFVVEEASYSSEGRIEANLTPFI